MKALVADVCVSEFGWELMAWQGFVRAQAAGYDTVVVCSTEALAPIYADLNPIFIGHRVSGQRDCHRMRTVDNPTEIQRAKQRVEHYLREFKAAGFSIKHIKPEKATVYPLARQRFVRYGNALASPGYDILVHARNRQHKMPFGGANWPVEKWNEVVTWCLKAGYRVGAVGTQEQAICPTQADDLRGRPLQEIMNAMAGARLVVGPSSGPMHLASLCGTPHLVWTGTRYQPVIRGDNKQRYESLWNPLKTPVHVIMKDWDPDPQSIVKAVEQSLRTIASA